MTLAKRVTRVVSNAASMSRWVLDKISPGVLVLAVGCGARTELGVPVVEDAFAATDGASDESSVDSSDVRDIGPESDGACVPLNDRCGTVEICGNGEDDDCNGAVDDGCPCAPGAVQACFAGPPGRRSVGVCRDGAQKCELTAHWGACSGGIVPRSDVCNGSDNLCNGCSQREDCPISCPSGSDPRVVDGQPFTDYALRGGDFYAGLAKSWRWDVVGGPCDKIAEPSFTVTNSTSQTATLFAKLSGDYTVTLTVITLNDTRLSCTWVVHIAGPGIRIEMCYPESSTQDLDLFVHKPGSKMAWYPAGATSFQPNPDSCGWFNCEAHIRGKLASGAPVPRADWGYAKSPLTECVNGPYGDEWKALGYCASPRLDLDNNLDEGIGVPENINIDAPRGGETFRVMVNNFSGTLARPLVNVYCAGRRVATYGEAPDVVSKFAGSRGDTSVGAIWRVCDVTAITDTAGKTVGCTVNAVHPPGATTGYDVTYNDPRY